MVWYQEGTITGPDQAHFLPSSGFLVAVNFMFSTFTRLLMEQDKEVVCYSVCAKLDPQPSGSRVSGGCRQAAID